jgi:hypothetical protein
MARALANTCSLMNEFEPGLGGSFYIHLGTTAVVGLASNVKIKMIRTSPGTDVQYLRVVWFKDKGSRTKVKQKKKKEKETPDEGLEPSATRLRVVRSTN